MPPGGRLYTADYVSGDITVIDAHTKTVIDSIDVPDKPSAITILNLRRVGAPASKRRHRAPEPRHASRNSAADPPPNFRN
jgi:YVTN family beta-propeller protein